MSAGPTLLEQVQRVLERTYAMDSGLTDVGRFVIGDRGYRMLYHVRRVPFAGAGTSREDGAQTLVREAADGVRACIYYPDGLIAHLERFPPQRGLDERNVDEFATLVEELDHLLLLAERARQGRRVTLLELELHANVSKHLVLERFLAGARRALGTAPRWWLRHQLFGKLRFADENEPVRRRYTDAARWAVRLLDALARRPARVRLELLRAFHRAPGDEKLTLIERWAGVASA